MLPLVGRRIIAAIPVLLLVSIVIFALLQAAQGDAARTAAGGVDAAPEDVERARERLGLNDPLLNQYLGWLGSVLRGDLGQSFVSSRSVAEAIQIRLPVTLSITILALFIGVIVAVVFGMLSALHKGGTIDRIIGSMSTLGIASPSFLVAVVLLLLFAIKLGWFPATGYVPLADDPGGWLKHATLPALTLAIPTAAELTRYVRGGMVDTLSKDYIKAGKVFGIPPLQLYFKYALKNACVPVLTILGLQLGHLLGGIVVVETIFATPGIGSLAVQAVFDRDAPLIQGVTLVTALLIVFVNIGVDIAHYAIDPKVRMS